VTINRVCRRQLRILRPVSVEVSNHTRRRLLRKEVSLTGTADCKPLGRSNEFDVILRLESGETSWDTRAAKQPSIFVNSPLRYSDCLGIFRMRPIIINSIETIVLIDHLQHSIQFCPMRLKIGDQVFVGSVRNVAARKHRLKQQNVAAQNCCDESGHGENCKNDFEDSLLVNHRTQSCAERCCSPATSELHTGSDVRDCLRKMLSSPPVQQLVGPHRLLISSANE
jgi:hypothetical protein